MYIVLTKRKFRVYGEKVGRYMYLIKYVNITN